MMEQKRSPVSIGQSSLTSLTPKRHKGDLSLSSKERKEKLGERIAALQQLVSPYGKTDTASVLWDAMEYINFLHEQVKVLSAPYLHSTSADKLESHIIALEAKACAWCRFHIPLESLAATVLIFGLPLRLILPNSRSLTSSPIS